MDGPAEQARQNAELPEDRNRVLVDVDAPRRIVLNRHPIVGHVRVAAVLQDRVWIGQPGHGVGRGDRERSRGGLLLTQQLPERSGFCVAGASGGVARSGRGMSNRGKQQQKHRSAAGHLQEPVIGQRCVHQRRRISCGKGDHVAKAQPRTRPKEREPAIPAFRTDVTLRVVILSKDKTLQGHLGTPLRNQ